MGDIADHYVDRAMSGESPAGYQGIDFAAKLAQSKQRAMFREGSDFLDHHAAQSEQVRRPPRDSAFGFARRPSGILVPEGSTAATVEDDHYDHVSASQLKTWHRCRRLWWLTKVCMIKEPSRAHFGVGHALHHISERYQLRLAKTWAEVFDQGWDKAISPEMAAWIRVMAAAAVEKGMWQATPDVRVEYPMAMLVGKEWRDERGMPWLLQTETYMNKHGVRSIRKPTKLIDGSPLPPGWDRLPVMVGFADQVYLNWSPPEVGDHKSAKNRKYATTSNKLAEDTQVLTYSAGVFFLRKDANEVSLRHNVFLKSESTAEGAYVVRAKATLPRVQQEWERTIQAAEDMKLLREVLPVHPSEYKSTQRANEWHRVKSAIEDGCAQESCNAYGGCAFKDLCNRRATAEQVVRRLDGGAFTSPSTGPPPPPVSFGLKYHPSTSPSPPRPTHASPFGLRPSQPRPPEPNMPFIKHQLAAQTQAAPAANPNDRYMLDPDNAKLQFRARLSPSEPPSAAGMVVLYLFPHLDVEPDWTKLSAIYRVEWEAAKVSTLPFVSAALVGYHEALLAAGVAAGEAAWADADGRVHVQVLTLNSPVQPPQVVPPASAATGMAPAVSVPSKPEQDGAFGLRKPTPGIAQGYLPPGVGGALAAQTARAAEPVPVPPPTFIPKVGQRVRVAAVEPSTAYFRDLAGKEGEIKEVNEGEIAGQMVLDVVLDGGYLIQHVVVGRFSLVSEPAEAPAQDVAQQVAQYKAAVRANVGKVVDIGIQGAAPVRCKLEAVDDEKGLIGMEGKLVVGWEKVESVAVVPEGALAPGEEPKKTRSKGKKGTAAAGEAPPAAAVPPVTPNGVPQAPPLFTVKDVVAKQREMMGHLAAANLCGAQITDMLTHVAP